MTEADWLTSADPRAMLELLRDRASERKLRLFACALARRLWHLLGGQRSRKAVEAAERFADGTDPKGEMTAAGAAAQQAAWAVCPIGPRFKDPRTAAAFATARYAAYATAWCAATLASSDAARAGVSGPAQRAVLHDLLGPLPLRPVFLSSAWLTPAVVSIARAAYDERILPGGTLDPARLAVLADALEEAGCTDANVLGHLRGPGTHVRGCHVLDAILGKE